MVHQLELITDLLGTPSPEVIAKVGRGRKQSTFVLLAEMAMSWLGLR